MPKTPISSTLVSTEASYESISWGQTAADLGVDVDSQELAALFYSVEDAQPHVIREKIEVQEGHSYLLRSSNEEYDLYAKLRITTYSATELIEFDYEILHIEAPEALCQRRDDVYQDWTENPADNITLYDRDTYNDSVKATFNVEMGTRDLVWDVHNSWHLIFSRIEFQLFSNGQIADLGDVELADVEDQVNGWSWIEQLVFIAQQLHNKSFLKRHLVLPGQIIKSPKSVVNPVEQRCAGRRRPRRL